MITFYGQEFSELKTPYNIVVAADVLEFVQGLTEWISYIMMLKYGGTSIGNESVTEPSRARADEKITDGDAFVILFQRIIVEIGRASCRERV